MDWLTQVLTYGRPTVYCTKRVARRGGIRILWKDLCYEKEPSPLPLPAPTNPGLRGGEAHKRGMPLEGLQREEGNARASGTASAAPAKKGLHSCSRSPRASAPAAGPSSLASLMTKAF